MPATSHDVSRHYEQTGLLDRILAALAEAGLDPDHLTIDDLAPVDEFHSRRRLATEELARLLAPRAGDRVIDIGSGIGGPSRYLAQTYGCRVSGVDLTAEFVAVAHALTDRMALTKEAGTLDRGVLTEGAGASDRRTLSERVDFRQGSALDLPFPDATFDGAWSQNVAMNIADRPRYYAEMHRVLRPGGRLAIQDVAQGPGGPVHFPVMWADRPEISFLSTPEDTRAMLEAAGFRVDAWVDNSEASMAEAAAERAKAPPGARPVLGIHLVVGPSFREKLQNMQRCMAENRTRLINAVLVKP